MNKKENVIKKKKVTSLDQVLQVKKKKGKIGDERKSAIDALENAAWRSGSTFTHELASKRATLLRSFAA